MPWAILGKDPVVTSEAKKIASEACQLPFFIRSKASKTKSRSGSNDSYGSSYCDRIIFSQLDYLK
jgi:hypothetical protein